MAPSRGERGPRNSRSLWEEHSRKRTLSPSGESRNTATVCGRSAASATASAPRRTSSPSATPASRCRSAASGGSDETATRRHAHAGGGGRVGGRAGAQGGGERGGRGGERPEGKPLPRSSLRKWHRSLELDQHFALLHEPERLAGRLFQGRRLDRRRELADRLL